MLARGLDAERLARRVAAAAGARAQVVWERSTSPRRSVLFSGAGFSGIERLGSGGATDDDWTHNEPAALGKMA